MENEKYEKNDRRIKLLEDYTENSTIHGISHVAKKKKIKQRVIWVLIICLSASGCAFFIARSFMDYLSYDVITNYRSLTLIPMIFPTVTICNMNSYNGNTNYSIDQMLLSCKFGLEKCYFSDFVPVKISTYLCYTFNNKEKEKTVSRPGYLYGLSLKLFAGFDDETKMYINGFLVFIHNRTEFPLVEQAIQVSTGQYSKIKVAVQLILNLIRYFIKSFI